MLQSLRSVSFVVCAVCLCVVRVSFASAIPAGTTTPTYITVQAGQLPIILTTPHGGDLKPASIVDRTAGCWTNNQCDWTKSCTPKDTAKCGVLTLSDSNTIALSDAIDNELFALTGKRAFRVTQLLHRSKLDANRPKDEGAQHDATAELGWDNYHTAIANYRSTVAGACYKGALLLDIHGQAHAMQWVELGYNLANTQLAKTDANLNADASALQSTSIRALATRLQALPTPVSLAALVRGAGSLGEMLQNSYQGFVGYKTVPSPTYPDPAGNDYYNGGYTIETYGSATGGVVDAVQIETPSSIRSDDTIRNDFARKVARVVVDFMTARYSYTLTPTANGNKCWGAFMEGIIAHPPTAAVAQSVQSLAKTTATNALQPLPEPGAAASLPSNTGATSA